MDCQNCQLLNVESGKKQVLLCQWHGDVISLLACLRGKESGPKNKHEGDVGIDGRIVLIKGLAWYVVVRNGCSLPSGRPM